MNATDTARPTPVVRGGVWDFRAESDPPGPTTLPVSGPSPGRMAIVYAALVALLVLIAVVSLSVGKGALSDVALRSTLLSLRASRLGAAVLVGGALAVAGVLVQGLLRNPLADASVLGTSAGATLFGNLTLLFVESLFLRHHVQRIPPDVLLPLGCLVGAMLSLALVFLFLRGAGDVLSVILTGFLLSSLFLSLGTLVTSMAQGQWEVGRALVAFALGGFTGTGTLHLALATPLVASGIGAAWFWAKPLDLLLSGDDEAASLGVRVAEVRRYCLLWVAVLTAGAVALGGNIGFVGLLVPHVLRPLVGVEHRRLVPLAALGGAVFVSACDLLVRVLPGRSEVPLGVITGLLGAPLFLFLLARMRRRDSEWPVVDAAHDALEIRGLSVRRGPRAALTGVDFSARAGRVSCILGPNGAGKSSLVKAVAGILPYQGSVRLDGRDARNLTSTERAKRVAYVPQQSSLDAPLPVASVVALGRYAHHVGRVRAGADDDEAVLKALAMTDTVAFATRPFTHLSQGEKQRVLLARALVTGARILLLDEPTSALDVGQALKLYALLRRLASDGYAVVAVLHPLHEAVAWTDDALLLDGGRVVLAARTCEVIREGLLEKVYGVALVPRGALGFVLPEAAAAP